MLDRRFGAGGQQQGRLGRRHPLRAAVEQRYAQAGLEPGDRLGQRGLRQVHHPRRAAETAMTHRCGQGGEVPNIGGAVGHLA